MNPPVSVMNPLNISKTAQYAHKYQNIFSGDQLYLFEQMLFLVNQNFTAYILLEQLINTKTESTSPKLLLKIADSLQSTNPILSIEAYSYVKKNPKAGKEERSDASKKYKEMKRRSLHISSVK